MFAANIWYCRVTEVTYKHTVSGTVSEELHCYSCVSRYVVNLYDILGLCVGFLDYILDPGILYSGMSVGATIKCSTDIVSDTTQMCGTTILVCVFARPKYKPQHYNGIFCKTTHKHRT